MNYSLPELADQLNDWCSKHQIVPASGQAAEEISPRTLRYYRTVGLLDGPLSGGGRGYGRRHFLQAAAVRILQAQGLPLNRIQSLLFGRSDEDLESIAEQATSFSANQPMAPSLPPVFHPETWNVIPLSEDFLLISRRAAAPPAAMLERLRAIVSETVQPFNTKPAL